MEFHKFNQIENISKFDDDQCGEWIALEKAHGANFSFVVSLSNVQCANRSKILNSTDKFFGHELIRKRYEHDMLLLYDQIIKVYPDVTSMQIYGELIGGMYIHPQVKKLDISRVQREVQYHPEHQVLFYDIMLSLLTKNIFLPFDEAVKFISMFPDLKVVPIVARGSFTEMSKLNPVYQTLIPNIFDLPEINNNFSEGYVIRNSIHHQMVKLKNLKFLEAPKQRVRGGTKKIQLDDSHELVKYINENRLASVRSKYVQDISRGELVKLVAQDAMEEYKKDYPENKFEENRLFSLGCKHSNILISK